MNTIESTIRVFKGINRTIGFGVPSEEPLKTRAEISMIYSHIANILNSRPLVADQGDMELVVNSNQLCKPFLSNTDQELILSKFLQSIFTDNEQSDFISKIFSNNSLMAKEACHLLKQEFLNCNSKLFTNKSEGLRPQVGDVVLVLKEEPRLGIIIEVLSPHRVTVRDQARSGISQPDIVPTIQTNFFHLLCRTGGAFFFWSSPSRLMAQTEEP